MMRLSRLFSAAIALACLVFLLLQARVDAAVSGAASFSAQNAVGQTAAVDVGVASVHAIQLVVTGSPAGCTYRLQGSNDGTNWFDISASDITCTSSAVSFEANKPARFVRGDLKTLTGGSSPTVTLHYAGK